MNEQIKQRINQLNNGEVPIGYEKTEIGTFPVGWKTTTLDKLLEFKNGVNADKEKYNSGVKMISVMDILTDSPIYYDKIKGQVDIDEKTLDTYSVTYGDILFQRSSETFEDAGKSNVYLDKDRTATYSGFVIRGKKKADYNPYFLNEALRIGQVRNQIIRNAAGSQHINVGQDSLAKIIVPLASDAEQSKIAEILMKWDEAIELQEEFLHTLEIKRMAILQSFFSKEKCSNWIKLSDYVKEVSNRNNIGCQNVKSVSNKNGFIDQSSQFSKQVASEDVSKYKVVTKDCVAYNPSRINVGSIAIYNEDTPGIVSPMYVVFKCVNMDPRFLLLLLETARGKYEVKSYLSGSVRDSLALEDLKSIEIAVPPKEKWGEIVDILNIIDAQHSLYNYKLSFLKRQRKALQQYLLNGIVRVK